LLVLDVSPPRCDVENGFHSLRIKDAGKFSWSRELNFFARNHTTPGCHLRVR
jgi:hypothetical protein